MAEPPVADSAELRVRHAAEAEKFLAEAEKIRAETRAVEAKTAVDLRNLEAQARKSEAEAELSDITLVERRRSYNESLTADKYHHIYYFTDSVGGSSVKGCIDRLALWHRLEPDCSIEIVFSSPGGSVIDGLVLYDYLLDLRRNGHRLTTSTLGWAASMAGILLQAGDERVMHREAWILIHEISFGAGGTMGVVEDTVEWLKRIQGRVLDIFASRCKQAGIAGTAAKPLTKAQLEHGWRRKDWWLSSDDCLRLGLVDALR